MRNTLLIFLAFVGLGDSLANTCLDKKDSHYLPTKIGSPQSAVPDAVLLRCDTMIVKEGDTSRIYSSEKIHFGSGSTDKKVILIRGTLIVEGTSQYPTLFAGSLMEFALGLKPTAATWGGFRIAESGTLFLRNTTIYNAPFAIDSHSKNVHLENVYTKGCSNLIKPGNEFVNLDASGTNITSLDFGPQENQVDKTVKRPVNSDSTQSQSHSTSYKKPLIWGGIGIATLGVAGVTILMLTKSDEGKTSPPVVIVQTYPADPGFPPGGGPRKP